MQEKKENIVRFSYDAANPPPLMPERKAKLEALRKMPDSEIDYSDIPPVTDFTGWRRANRHLPVFIDTDIVAWLQTLDANYSEQANAILRKAMISASKE